MEVRNKGLRAGKYFLGNKKTIHGYVLTGPPILITSQDQWDQLRPLHHVRTSNLPYERTFGLPIVSAQRLGRTVPFVHPRGAMGIVKYR